MNLGLARSSVFRNMMLELDVSTAFEIKVSFNLTLPPQRYICLTSTTEKKQKYTMNNKWHNITAQHIDSTRKSYYGESFDISR